MKKLLVFACLILCILAFSFDCTASSESIIEPGSYLAGRDIDVGSHLITLDGFESVALICTFDSEENLNAYLSYSSGNKLSEKGKTAFYVKPGETAHIYLDNGDWLLIQEGQGHITPDDGQIIHKGVYQVGRDISSGQKLFNFIECDGYNLLATFPDSDHLISYVIWDSGDRLAEKCKTAFYANESYPVHLALCEGDLFYLSSGQGIISECEQDVVCSGVYIVGQDIQPGSYIMSIVADESVVIATFSDSESLGHYISWDSSARLKEYSKKSFYADPENPFYISLDDQDIFYIKSGMGMILDNNTGNIYPGIYEAGKDLPEGKITLIPIEDNDSPIVAVFESMNNLLEYSTFSSYNKLEQYSKEIIKRNSEGLFDVSLSHGDILFVQNCFGFSIVAGDTMNCPEDSVTEPSLSTDISVDGEDSTESDVEFCGLPFGITHGSALNRLLIDKSVFTRISSTKTGFEYSASGLEIAGYSDNGYQKTGASIRFVYTLETVDSINQSKDSALFYEGQYYITGARTKDNETIAKDLKVKLTSIYGDPDDGYDTYGIWHKDGITIELFGGTSVVTIKYTWDKGAILSDEVQALINRTVNNTEEPLTNDNIEGL